MKIRCLVYTVGILMLVRLHFVLNQGPVCHIKHASDLGVLLQISSTWYTMEALKGHVKFLKKVLYLLIRTYASPN